MRRRERDVRRSRIFARKVLLGRYRIGIELSPKVVLNFGGALSLQDWGRG
jgi:hypothetical protein